MPDQPVAEPADAPSPAESPVTAKHRRNASQLPTYVALGIAVIAVVLAALAYFHPAHHAANGSAQQGGDAKANLCSAYTTARRGVMINTHLKSPQNNQVAELSVAANARLALVGGGAYLQQRLAANSAAPADLSAAVDSLANTMQQLGVSYLAGATAATLDPLRHDLDSEVNQVTKACA